MNQFLSEKARRRKGWEIPALLGELALIAMVAEACREVYDPDERMISLLASCIMLLLSAWPLILLLKRWKCRAAARKAAAGLAAWNEEDIPFDEAQKLLKSPYPLVDLCGLIGKGYLTNVELNPDRGCLELYK